MPIEECQPYFGVDAHRKTVGHILVMMIRMKFWIRNPEEYYYLGNESVLMKFERIMSHKYMYHPYIFCAVMGLYDIC